MHENKYDRNGSDTARTYQGLRAKPIHPGPRPKHDYAVVQNTGKLTFSIRVQQQGRIINEIPIQDGEVKRVKLLKGQELYLDPNKEGKAEAVVDYEEIE